MLGWLHQQGIKYTDFKNYAPKLADRLVQHAKDTAAAAGRPYEHHPQHSHLVALSRQHLAHVRNLTRALARNVWCMRREASPRVAVTHLGQ